jgi:hypothetical protein
MKRKSLLLLLTALVLMVSYTTAQQNSTKELPIYHGKAGITKKISELPKVTTKRPLELKSIKPLRTAHGRDINTSSNGIWRNSIPIGKLNVSKGAGEGEKFKSKSSSTSVESTNHTVQIRSNFLALDYYKNPIGWPPDPSGAVSDSQVIVSTNNGFTVFEKTSATDSPILTPTGYSNQLAPAQLFLSLEQFFAPVSTIFSFLSDPHIRYDRLTKRWFVVCGDFADNRVLLAVSNGGKITDTSSFTYFSFNSSLIPYNPSDPYSPFFDYPTLGVDANSVLIGGQQFLVNDQFYLDSIKDVAYVVDKKMLLQGDLVVKPFLLGALDQFTTFVGSGMYVPQGVQNDDPEAKESFFAGVSHTFFGIFYDYDSLVIAKLTYDKFHRPHLKEEKYLQIPAYDGPLGASTPGGLTPIDQLDSRLFAAEIHKNKLTGKASLWTSHAIAITQSGGHATTDSDYVNKDRCVSRWYELGDIYTAPVVSQMGTIGDLVPESGRRAVQYFNPSIAANGQGHAVMGGTTATFDQYLNVFVASHYNGDPKGSFSTPVKATNTTAFYAPWFVPGAYVGRWGDFSQTVVDPEDDQTIWSFQEYAAVDDDYGVRVVQVRAPAPAVPLPFGSLSNDRDTVINLEGVDVDNRGFFDPGDEKKGPGYNRLKVRSTGGIAVSDIKFISPTEISFKLHTQNKPAGSYTLRVINPDGQSVTTDYIINSTNIAVNNSAHLIGVNNKMGAAVTTRAISPNPTSGDARLQLTAASDFAGKVLVIDMNGKVIQQYANQFVKGGNNITLQLANLGNGNYIVAVYNGNNLPVAVQKVVKQ